MKETRLPRTLFPTCSALLLLLVLVTGPGCATRRSVETLETKLDRLEQENFQLRKDLTEARVRLQVRSEKMSEARTAPVHEPGQAQAVAALEPVELPAEPAVLFSEPITDTTRYRGAPSATLPGAGESARALMEEAKDLLDLQDPEAAMQVFRQVVTRFPDDGLADDAQFGLGESLFQMGRYEEAMAEYRKVGELFPFGDNVPLAFLKIGFAHLALDDRQAALDNFRTVSEAYPGTEAATVARQQIAHLQASSR